MFLFLKILVICLYTYIEIIDILNLLPVHWSTQQGHALLGHQMVKLIIRAFFTIQCRWDFKSASNQKQNDIFFCLFFHYFPFILPTLQSIAYMYMPFDIVNWFSEHYFSSDYNATQSIITKREMRRWRKRARAYFVTPH